MKYQAADTDGFDWRLLFRLRGSAVTAGRLAWMGA